MRKRLSPALCLLLAIPWLAACSEKKGPVPEARSPERPAARRAIIEDDYAKALALARERGVPLFVDAWAPWCHSCLSMKANVLGDPRLDSQGARFVWLTIDTEKEQNAAFLERFPVEVWPTLFVIDPREERAALRWLGAATVEQLLALLDDGSRALGAGEEEGPDALLAKADRLHAEGSAAEALPLLEEALRKAPATWERRARAVNALLIALRFGKRDVETCASIAQRELESLPRDRTWANVAAMGFRCALELPAENEAPLAALEARVREALASPEIPVEGDDRSNLYEILLRAQQKRGDREKARADAEAWLAFLEGEAAKASTPEARAVFDSHRLVAAFALDAPERALDALLQSQRDFPGDYNPPSRLALVYLRLDRLDEALAASERALSLVYGPRKVRVLNDKGDILLKKGDMDGARAAFEAAAALVASLPEAQRPKHQMERSRKALAALAPKEK